MERLILEFAFRAGLIFLTTALVLRVLRIKVAAAQHAAWVGVLMAMLLLPLWLAWGPKAGVPVLPASGEPVAAVMQTAAPTDFVADTFSIAEPGPVSQSTPTWNWNTVALFVYLLGAFVLLLRLAIGTIRANCLSSDSCVAPVTMGLFRPRIILPASSADWPQAQLDAVMTHEREHARRRDPLFQWLALFNRAVFWFHPLAWWLERKLSALAEEACDAAVLERGHDPREYSVYLLDLARAVQRAGTRVNVVAMAMPGSYLPQRVRKIIDGVRAPRISRMRMACVALACAIPAMVFAAGTLDHAPQILRLPMPVTPAPKPPVLLAQASQSKPAKTPDTALSKLEFEATSIRPSPPSPPKAGLPPGAVLPPDLQGGPGTSDPGQITYRGIFLAGLVERAYGVNINQVYGLGRVGAERFDLVAKVPKGATQEQFKVMLQNLLVERFSLKLHRETSVSPAYELTIAKGGIKFKESPKDDPPEIPKGTRIGVLDDKGFPTLPPGYSGVVGMPSNGHLRLAGQRAVLSKLIGFLSLDQPVVDQTGLTGEYDFKLDVAWITRRDPDAPPTADPGDAASDPAPSVFDAMEKQLGLKLELRKLPLEMLVIDHIDSVPTDN